ncbi:Flp family type IVb pilin [Aliivibrio fischeri]|uniref:Flp family type IVb pilin n=1 Tax=Aliivibrio fischeri TaxID=668 RepID=UPI0007C4C8FC|nr:Flp family type IVb pilin [Aliivibrio fischeri]
MLTKLFVNSQLALQSFKNDERGVTAIEYAIIGVCISAIVLAVFNGTLRDALEGAMSTISSNIEAANTAPEGPGL